jgi:predicted CxxxxCH...CXXCH cytochrome family protein
VTCHGLHYTDSDTTSTDGPSQSLNQGDGLLLRGNGSQFTATVSGDESANGTYPTGTSICTECHNYDSATHSGDHGAVGCLACHGGHVYNGGVPNIYMLNDPSGSYAIDPANIASLDKSVAWAGDTPGVIDGFCENCHGNVESDWDTVRNHSANIGEDCTTCHQNHSAGAFSEPLGCDGCHGSPPSVNAPGNAAFGAGYDPGGYAWVDATYNYAQSGHVKDESATPHSSHSGTSSRYGYTCSVCHNTHLDDFAGSHNIDNASFRDVLESGHPFDTKAVATDAGNPGYIDASGACNTVYCHSNGGVNDGGGNRIFTFTTPAWAGTKGSIVGQGTECSSCHGNSATNMGSATHDKHIAAAGHAYGCNVCHVNTATSSTDLVGDANSPPATHVNQTVNVAFDSATAIKAGGTAVAHGASPYSDATAMTCSAVYCHSSGQSSPASRTYQAISWTTAGPLTCTSCHDVPSASQTTAHTAHVSGSTSNVGRDLDCAVCHDATMDAGINNALGTGGLVSHVNGVVNINMNTELDSGNCSNISCHSDGNYGGTMTYNNPAWTSAPLNLGCDDCHGNGIGNPAPSYDYAAAAGSEDANSHGAHVATINCEECHLATSVDGTALKASAPHVDQAIDVSFKQGGTWDGTVTNKTCSSTACHVTGTPQWGGTVNCGDCHAANNTLADSHSAHYNSASVGSFDETLTGGTITCGVCHSLNQGTTHAGGPADANYAAEVNFDGTIAEGTATYTPGATFASDPLGFDFSEASCANLYCHGNFGGNGNNVAPVWNNAASGACGTCHDVDATVTMSGGSHDKHVKGSGINCDFCHGATAVNAAGGITNRALHANQVLNWQLDTSKSQLTASSTYDGTNTGTRAKAQVGNAGNFATCSNVYCHSDVQAVPPSGLTGVTFSNPTWGGSAPCGSCHKGDAVGVEQNTASHTIHVDQGQYAKACSTCHNGAGSGTAKHADYAVDVTIDATWGGSYSGTAMPGDAYGSCASNYCHSGGTDGSAPFTDNPNAAATWNADLTCESCHSATTADTNTMATGSHGEHFVTANIGYEVACDKCHAATTTGMLINSYTNHVNQAVNVKFDGSLAADGEVNLDGDAPTYNGSATIGGNGATKAAGTPAGACNNLYCHSIGNLDGDQGSVVTAGGTDFRTITWGGAAINCDDCHGDAAGKAHPVYTSGTVASTTANSHVKHVEDSGIGCDSCHASTTTTNTSIDGTTHLDRIETVDFKSIGGKTGTYDNTVGAKSCSTTYCHGAGIPQWGGPTLDCSSCHNAGNALADSHGLHYALAASTVNSTSLTASNTSSGSDYQFSCGVCHDSISHAGGPAVPGSEQTAEVKFDAALVNSATLGTPSYAKGLDEGFVDNGFTYTRGTCSSTYCHSDGDGAFGNVTPQWNAATLNTECSACHNNNESATIAAVAGDRTMSSGSHTAHVTYNTTSVTACANCHSVTVSDDRTVADTAYHVNRAKNVDIAAALDSDATTSNNYNSGTSECSNIYCHSPGQNSTGGALGAGDYAMATWANPASGACGTCHAVTEVSGLTSGSHSEHLGTAGVNGCADCHTGAANDASSYNSIEHVDVTIDVANSYTTGGAPGNGYGTCTAASCHDDGTGTPAETPVWGTAGGCASCHASDMTTASHGDHLTTTISANTISCGNCHDGAVKDTTAPTTHLDGDLDVYDTAAGDLGYPNNVAKGGAPYDSCSTTYCHGDTLSYSVIDGIDTSPQWGANLGARADNCDACHAYPPDGGGSHPSSASCVDCHDHVNAGNNGFADVSKHIDGTVQVTGGDTCTDCHGGGAYKDPDSGDHAVHTDADIMLAGLSLTSGDYGTSSNWYSVSYDASGRPLMGCGQCHPAGVGTHLNTTLETDLDPAGETISSPNAKLGSLTGAAYSSATGTCSNVYCHSDGDGSFADIVGWNLIAGDKGITCASCHGNSPTTNAHGVHEVGIHYEELYDDDGVGLMAASPNELGESGGTAAAHGNSDLSTTINCFTCHSGTVTDSANSDNSTCITCHNGDTGNAVTGAELARIAVSSSIHLNGQPDVSFADLSTFKSKAQLRDNLADADDGSNVLSTIWKRLTGYKAGDGSSTDEVQVAFATPSFSAGTCSTVVCHNGIDTTWEAPQNNCMACHTSLPK